jgi:NitT/TauT family transport system ATP-binding protein
LRVIDPKPETALMTSPSPAAPPASILALEGVTFGYALDRPIVEGLNWQIGEGESWSILGPSGSGKTTLLYLLAGLRRPSGGQVCFRGTALTGPSRDVGLMLQDYGLLPWMNAERNVGLGLKIRGVPRAERHRIRREWLERMQIAHIARQYPAQMSGGQRQRVALARVLALQTDVLLLDEPLSAVDELTRERLQKTLWEIRTELGMTMALVTHSVEEAALLTDHTLIFPERGPLRQPTVLHNPFAGGPMPRREDPAFQNYCRRIREELGL